MQIEMMRNFGLRFEESCKINATKAFKEASQKGILTVTSGTKGGLARVIPAAMKNSLERFREPIRSKGIIGQ